MRDRVVKCIGWVSQYNPLALQPGALRKALNISIRREDVIEDRRGHKVYGTLSSAPSNFFNYQGRIIVHQGSTVSYDNGSGTFSNYSGSVSAISGQRVRSLEAFSNLYLTTSLGVKVYSDITGSTPRLAGAPRALDPSYSLTGSTGFLANNYQCAYRCVIRRTDSQSNTVTGYPSQRLWVTNSAGGARNVILTTYLPSECASGDVIQFYRTEQASGVSSDSSGDEMGLVYQYELVSADISAGYVTFTDSVTDTLRGATLYTSPSQEGIGQANDRPPLARDICLYKSNYMLYANTETKQRLSFSLVGASGIGFQTTGDTHSNTTLDNIANTTNIAVGWKVEGTGIPANTTVSAIVGSTVTLSQAATATAAGVTITFITNKTLILGGTTYSFGSSEISSGAGSPQIQVSVTGVAATDIDLTARSLVRVVNRYASNTTIYAYYLSGPDDFPGQILTEEKGIGASAFTIQTNSSALSTMFFPAPPVSPSTNTKSTSTSSRQKNALYYSKSQQGEHVPILNYLLVGPANEEILRVVALRDSAIIVKENGVYRLTGETPQSFSIVPVDLTLVCKGMDSVCVLSNQVIMLSNQGVVSISEGGAQVISHQIEPELTPLLSVSSISSYTAAVAYESDRSYFISTITESSDTTPNQTLVYNTVTKAWVKHTYAFKAAIVEKTSDKMYFAKPSVATVYVERKDLEDSDFADPETSITITAISGNDVDFTISGATPDVGWVILQGTTGIAIESIATVGGGYRATMIDDIPASWTTGAATIYPSVGAEWEYHAWTASQPEALKQVMAVGVLTDDIDGANSVSSLVATFKSNFDAEIDEVTITQPGLGWGSAWGSSPWGGAGDSFGYPTYVPRNKQYCNRLYVGVKHVNARERISSTGIAYFFNMSSERMSK